MNRRVALATSLRFSELTVDDQPVLTALSQRGFEACPAVWNDTTIDWHAFDVVVIRSTWDYVERYHDFLAWAASLRGWVLNPKEVLNWNIDKNYLRALEAAGVPVVPTLWIDNPEAVEREFSTWLERPDVANHYRREFVVKPSVSASARDTVRLSHRESLRKPIEMILRSRRVAMVQPYFFDVDTHGEIDLIFFRGEFSHAVRKAALLNGGHRTEEIFTPCDPSAAERELAERVFEALPFAADDLLYTRIDLIRDHVGRPTVLEVELVEPSLFLGSSKGAHERFARALEDLIACGGRGRL